MKCSSLNIQSCFVKACFNFKVNFRFKTFAFFIYNIYVRACAVYLLYELLDRVF